MSLIIDRKKGLIGDKALSKVDFSTYMPDSNVKENRKRISRLVSLANKRLKRLEEKGLTSSPAYKKWLDNGGEKFSVKGKDHNQLQRELSRLKQFIESETSTVRGVNNTLKTMAANTGIEYKNLNELRASADTFFELASKVEQYLRNVDDIASAIGYQKIWESINQYVKDERIDLSNAKGNMDEMIKVVTEMLKASNNTAYNDADSWWFIS